MAITLPGGSGTDVILPEGVSTEQVDIAVGSDGNTVVAIKENTSGLDIEAKSETAVTGKKITDTTVNVTAKKGEDTNIVLETTVAKSTTITNEGKGAIEVNVNTGKVKGLTIDAGNKKRADLVRIKDDVKLIDANFKLGKGNDNIRIGKGVTFKGTSSVDLGKGGKDTVTVEGKAKLDITNFSKKDTLNVGDDSYNFKDIKNGAEIKGISVDLA